MYMMTPFVRSMMDLANPFLADERRTFDVDVRKTDSGWELKADLPGVKRENIEITVEKDVLTITASHDDEKRTAENGYTHVERSTGKFTRSFTINKVDREAVTADYMDGVLTLNLPLMKEAEPEVRRIAIGGKTEDTVA